MDLSSCFIAFTTKTAFALFCMCVLFKPDSSSYTIRLRQAWPFNFIVEAHSLHFTTWPNLFDVCLLIQDIYFLNE